MTSSSRRRRAWAPLFALTLTCSVMAACGSTAPAPEQAAAAQSAVPATAPGTAASTPAAAAAPATPAAGAGNSTNKIDMNAIFPAGAGRDLVLNNCQNCHTFVPIVVLQMEEAAWTRSSVDHRPRVTGLSDEDFTTLYDYLKANFNPSHPVPALPQALLDTWTGN